MPIYPKPEDILFYEGPHFAVEWYYTIDGCLPAFEYFQQLPEVDRHQLRIYAKFIGDHPYGIHLPITMYRLEDKEHKIYAFKPRNQRFFNFMTVDGRIIITNAYQKHSQQMTKQDLEELRYAARSRNDYLQRLKEGTYYET